MFKHGDRTIWLKLFERLVHGRIAPHILPRLDETQGGFRWGADALVYSWVDTLRLRQETHTFCAFIDVRMAFDTAWVEATLVRLGQVGVTSGMWRTITNFLVGTLSHVRVGDAHSHSWVDTGIAQGRVLPPPAFQSPREQRGCGHPSVLSRCPPASLVKSHVRLPVICR